MSERRGLVREMWEFSMENKAYWIAPIVLVILLLSALVALSFFTGGAATPFIYTLF